MNDNIKGVTEVGKAIYPHLNKPDTRFQKEGVYKVTLELSPVNAKNLLKHIDDGIALATKDSKSNKTASLPYKTDDNDNIQFKWPTQVCIFQLDFCWVGFDILYGINKKIQRQWTLKERTFTHELWE